MSLSFNLYEQERHDIAEILLNLSLNINQSIKICTRTAF